MRENPLRHQIQCSDWLEWEYLFPTFAHERDTFHGLLKIIIGKDNMGVMKKYIEVEAFQ